MANEVSTPFIIIVSVQNFLLLCIKIEWHPFQKSDTMVFLKAYTVDLIVFP